MLCSENEQNLKHYEEFSLVETLYLCPLKKELNE